MNEMMLTSEQWAHQPEFSHITVVDPDGWDRQNFNASWRIELVSKAEFQRRLMSSTCVMKRVPAQ